LVLVYKLIFLATNGQRSNDGAGIHAKLEDAAIVGGRINFFVILMTG